MRKALWSKRSTVGTFILFWRFIMLINWTSELVNPYAISTHTTVVSMVLVNMFSCDCFRKWSIVPYRWGAFLNNVTLGDLFLCIGSSPTDIFKRSSSFQHFFITPGVINGRLIFPSGKSNPISNWWISLVPLMILEQSKFDIIVEGCKSLDAKSTMLNAVLLEDRMSKHA